MNWGAFLSSPYFVGLVAVVVGAALSATAAATRLTHPRLSAWLSAFAAALPADVTRMSPGAAPRTAPPQLVVVPDVAPQDDVPTVPTPREPPL